MSVSINEAGKMMNNIDVEGTVQNMQRPEWIYKKDGSLAKVCNAELVSDEGERIRISLWGEQINKVKDGIRIAMFNAYTKSFLGLPYLNVGKHGWIEVLDFNPNNTFYDMSKFLKYEKHVKTFEEYYNYVDSLDSNIYLGTKKTNYLEILESFLTIKQAREKGTRNNFAEQESIFFLHRNKGLSPVMIKRILNLLGIHVSISRILRLSSQWSTKRFMSDSIKVSHKLSQPNYKKVNEEKIVFETSYDHVPEEMVIIEEPKIQNTSGPLCQSPMEFDLKYKDYHDFYSVP